MESFNNGKSPNLTSNNNELDIPNFNSSFNSSGPGAPGSAKLRNPNRESSYTDGVVDPLFVREDELQMGMLLEPEEREKYTDDELVTLVCTYEKLTEEIQKVDERLQKLAVANSTELDPYAG